MQTQTISSTFTAAAPNLNLRPKSELKAGSLTQAASKNDAAPGELREKFDSFVGETFYGQMLSSMRKTVGKPAYFHGGRAEEIFQGQLDQVIAEKLTASSAEKFTGPMFELFSLERK